MSCQPDLTLGLAAVFWSAACFLIGAAAATVLRRRA